MLVIGITGGSGSGKSYVCNALAKLGYIIIDADKIAREIVMPGEAALAQIVSAFGKTVLLADGSLNRRALAALVFSDQNKLERLNQITHKYITERINTRLALGEAMYIIDAPLLYEAGLDALCDVVIGVTAEFKVRLERIKARDGLTEEEAQRRLNAQKSIEMNLSKVDLCIDTTNNSPADALASELDTYIKGAIDENH